MTINTTTNSVQLTNAELFVMRDAARSFAYKGEPISPELLGESYDDINSFVFLPNRQKAALSGLYGSGANVEALLQADWHIARELGAVRLFIGSKSTNISFPIHVCQPDGRYITVSIRQNWGQDSECTKPWYLSFVPEVSVCDETTCHRSAAYGVNGPASAVQSSGAESVAAQKTLPRDEFAKWACFKWEDILPSLAEQAVPERWDFESKDQESPSYEILRNYLSYTFHRLQLEGKVRESEESGLAAFDTGLLHKTNLAPIYACFWIMGAGRPHNFAGFCRVGVGSLGKALASAFSPLPERASYLSCVEDILYDTSKEFAVDYEHVLLDNINRLPLEFLESELCGNSEAKKVIQKLSFCNTGSKRALYDELADLVKGAPALYRRLTCALESAINLALRAVERNYRMAIPSYYVSADMANMLIPLDLTGNGSPDVVLAAQRTDSGAYLSRTVLTLQMAYKGARLVGSLEDSWLSAAVSSFEGRRVCRIGCNREAMLLSA